MEFLRKIIHIISFILYFLIALYIITLIPIIFGYKPEVVLSNSMYPTIKKGNLIYYKNINKDKLKVGDIVTYKTNNYTITHRIYSINNNLYTTKGDNNNTIDNKEISYNDILGKVSNIRIPIIGYGINFLNNNIYIFYIVVFILILEFCFTNCVFKLEGRLYNGRTKS